MSLDPQVKLVLDNLPSDLLDVRSTTPLELRKLYEGQTQLPFLAEPVAAVRELRAPGPEGEIPVRIYTPEGDGPHPGIVFFHGGGWVIGNRGTTGRATPRAPRPRRYAQPAFSSSRAIARIWISSVPA